MKTFTLKLASLVLAFLAGSMSYAASIEQDFTKDETNAWLPTAPAEFQTYTSPISGTWGLYNAKYTPVYKVDAPGYLMVYQAKKGIDNTAAAGYVVLPTISGKVSSIEVTTTKASSLKVIVDLFAGTKGANNSITWEAIAIDSKKLDKYNETYTYAIAGKPAGTVYKLQVSNNYNAQFANIKINEATSDPTVTFKDNNDVEFGTGLNGTQEKTITVIGANLTDNITISLDGTNASKFTPDVTTLPADGGDIKVTYTGATAGLSNAILKVTSGNANAQLNLAATTVNREGTKSNPFSVMDVIALNNTTEGTFWIKGIIAGSATNASTDNPDGIAPKAVATNLALKENGASTTVPVELPTGDIRSSLNLVDNSGNLDKEVMILGTLTSYFSRAGLKTPSNYVLDPATGITSDLIEALRVFAMNGSIYIQGAQDNQNVEVYDMSGRSVAKTTVKNLRSGAINGLRNQSMYLVKVGDKVRKVALY